MDFNSKEIEHIRRHDPRLFYRIVKETQRLGNKGVIAIKFRSQVADGRVVESISFSDYLKNLYQKPDQIPASASFESAN